MKKLVDLIMLDRLDNLIRLRATGAPDKLADRLGISYASLHETIGYMKKVLNAPIKYDKYMQSYVYEYKPDFYFGFEKDRMKPH